MALCFHNDSKYHRKERIGPEYCENKTSPTIHMLKGNSEKQSRYRKYKRSMNPYAKTQLLECARTSVFFHGQGYVTAGRVRYDDCGRSPHYHELSVEERAFMRRDAHSLLCAGYRFAPTRITPTPPKPLGGKTGAGGRVFKHSSAQCMSTMRSL